MGWARRSRNSPPQKQRTWTLLNTIRPSRTRTRSWLMCQKPKYETKIEIGTRLMIYAQACGRLPTAPNS